LTDMAVKVSDACCMHTQLLRHGANMIKHDYGAFTYRSILVDPCLPATKLLTSVVIATAENRVRPVQNQPPDSHAAQSPPAVTLTGEYTKIVIGPDDLKDYVGPPPFTSDRIYETTPPGVVMGLAWTSMGGNSLYIEAAGVEKGEGKGSLRTTGQHALLQVSNLLIGCIQELDSRAWSRFT